MGGDGVRGISGEDAVAVAVAVVRASGVGRSVSETNVSDFFVRPPTATDA